MPTRASSAAPTERTPVLSVRVALDSLLGSLWLILPITVLTLIALATFGPTDQRTVVVFLINVVMVVGLGTFAGNAGVLSFGHAAFVALGAYLGGILLMTTEEKALALPDLPGFLASLHFATPLALVVTALAIGAIAFLPGLVVTRMAPSAAVLGTFALLVLNYDVLTGARSITQGTQTFFGVPPVATITTCLVCAVIAVVIARMYRDSSPGMRLRAVREDSLAASSVGIEVARNRLVAWVISAMICAAGGLLLGAFIGAFSPKTFYLTLTFQLLAMLLVGGWTTVSGAVVGAGAITFLTSLLDDLASGPGPLPEFLGLTEVGISVAILTVLYFRRDGLVGRLELDEHFAAFRRRRRESDLKSGNEAESVSMEETESDLASARVHSSGRAGELVVSHLSKSFEGLHVLRGVDLRVGAREIFGVIGPNGSGKTTLVNAITGVTPPDSGSVIFSGNELAGNPTSKISRAGIGRTFQNIRLFPSLTVRQNVQVSVRPHGGGVLSADSADSLLAAVGLSDMADVEGQALPYGSQRRLEIARALATDPGLLMVDEPAAGLNDAETERLLETFRGLTADHGIGVFIIDHNLGLMMRLCDRIMVLDQGTVIADGTPAEIKTNPEVIRAYMGSNSSKHNQGQANEHQKK